MVKCRKRRDDPMTILCYDRCSTCQKALKWLDLKGVDYTVRPIKE